MGRRMSRKQSWNAHGGYDIMGLTQGNSQGRTRDTGFPEPFCGNGNTTLPHPDAIIGPNACITQDDLCQEDRRQRLRPTKYKRTISHGKINEVDEQMYSSMAAPVVGRNNSALSIEVPRPPSKDGGNSLASRASSTLSHDFASPRPATAMSTVTAPAPKPLGRHRRVSSDASSGSTRSFLSFLGFGGRRHHYDEK